MLTLLDQPIRTSSHVDALAQLCELDQVPTQKDAAMITDLATVLELNQAAGPSHVDQFVPEDDLDRLDFSQFIAYGRQDAPLPPLNLEGMEVTPSSDAPLPPLSPNGMVFAPSSDAPLPPFSIDGIVFASSSSAPLPPLNLDGMDLTPSSNAPLPPLNLDGADLTPSSNAPLPPFSLDGMDFTPFSNAHLPSSNTVPADSAANVCNPFVTGQLLPDLSTNTGRKRTARKRRNQDADNHAAKKLKFHFNFNGAPALRITATKSTYSDRPTDMNDLPEKSPKITICSQKQIDALMAGLKGLNDGIDFDAQQPDHINKVVQKIVTLVLPQGRDSESLLDTVRAVGNCTDSCTRNVTESNSIRQHIIQAIQDRVDGPESQRGVAAMSTLLMVTNAYVSEKMFKFARKSAADRQSDLSDKQAVMGMSIRDYTRCRIRAKSEHPDLEFVNRFGVDCTEAPYSSQLQSTKLHSAVKGMFGMYGATKQSLTALCAMINVVNEIHQVGSVEALLEQIKSGSVHINCESSTDSIPSTYVPLYKIGDTATSVHPIAYFSVFAKNKVGGQINKDSNPDKFAWRRPQGIIANESKSIMGGVSLPIKTGLEVTKSYESNNHFFYDTESTEEGGTHQWVLDVIHRLALGLADHLDSIDSFIF